MRRGLAFALLVLLSGCSKKQDDGVVADDLLCSLRQLLNDSDYIVEGTLASYDPETHIGVLTFQRALRGRSPESEARLDFTGGIPLPTASLRRHLLPGAPLLWFSNGSVALAYLNRFFMTFYWMGDATTGKWGYSMVEGGMNKAYNGSLPKLSSLVRDVLSGNVPAPELDPNVKPISAADLRALPVWGEPVDEEYLPPCFRKGKPAPIELRAPDKAADLVSGLRITTFLGSWSEPPKFETLEVLEKGVAESLTVAPFSKSEVLRVRFQGYLEVPKDGIYVFTLAREERSIVALSVGTSQLVSVSRGPRKECGGEIGLKAGKHTFRLTYAALEGERNLEVFWAGPGFTRQTIPTKAFFRDP